METWEPPKEIIEQIQEQDVSPMEEEESPTTMMKEFEFDD
jgi:hypothetical protein